MSKTAIITDSNSGFTQDEAKKLGIYVIPMPFTINEQMYLEGVDLSREQFFKFMNEDADIYTSQPAPGGVCELWDTVLEEYDEILHIPMSSALSSTHDTAVMLSQDYNGKVLIVDNKRISVTQYQSVLNAKKLSDEGVSAIEIKRILEENQNITSIYLMVDTLKHLKKGGRITSTAAAIGTVLNIKPVLQIQGGKLDSFAKARGVKQAKRIMLDAMSSDLVEKYSNEKMILYIAHTCLEEEVLQWKADVEEKFPNYEVKSMELPLSISCHVGEGVLAIASAKQL